jgi:hypothetical protein
MDERSGKEELLVIGEKRGEQLCVICYELLGVGDITIFMFFSGRDLSPKGPRLEA